MMASNHSLISLSASNQFCPERPFPPHPMWDQLLNLFLDCFSPGCFRSALLSSSLRVHLKANLGILLWEILKICPSHRRLRLLIVVWIFSEFVLACNSKFEIPCTDTLLVVGGLASYRDSESCAGKVQQIRRGWGRVGRRKSTQRSSNIRVLRRTNDPTK